MGKYVLVSRVPMLNGQVVEPIEIRNDGVSIYPYGTIIQIVMTEKAEVTAERSRLPVPKSNQHNPEQDCFENSYGFDRLTKEMLEYKDKLYLEKLNYWKSEEGQARIDEMRGKPQHVEAVIGFKC